VNAQCDKVVGHQFITRSVHLCVQHEGRIAARRAGLSVAAETYKSVSSTLKYTAIDQLVELDSGKTKTGELSLSHARPVAVADVWPLMWGERPL